MDFWVSGSQAQRERENLTKSFSPQTGSSEILGRALIGNSPEVPHDERIFFEEMFRAKNATAQWVPLHEPAHNLGATAKTQTKN